MYSRTSDFIAKASVKGSEVVAAVCLSTAGGRRLYGKVTPPPSLIGSTDSTPLLSKRADLVKTGVITESLSSRSSETMGLLSDGRSGDLTVTLANNPDEDARLHFGKLIAPGGEGLVGSQVELVLNYPGLTSDDSLSRFHGRVRRVELTQDKVILRVRAV